MRRGRPRAGDSSLPGPDADIATERGLTVEGGGGAAGLEPGYTRRQEALEHVLEGVVLLGEVCPLAIVP